MRLVIDHSRCRRTGQCSYLHPELFQADTDGSPIIRVEHPDGELREAAEEAVELCPSGAVSLVEE